MIKCVIFDFGDTLVKSIHNESVFILAYKNFLNKHHMDFSVNKIKQAHYAAAGKWKKLGHTQKTPTKFYFEKIFFSALGLSPRKELSCQLHEEYTKLQIRRTKLFPSAKCTLKKLHDKKIILCVITNTDDNTNRIIAKKKTIYKYFTHFLMSHEEGTIKSELKIFNILLRKVNKRRKDKIHPNECLMVGNNLNEDTAASKLGIKTAILTKSIEFDKKRQVFEPDYYIDNLNEIQGIIEIENKNSDSG